MIPSMFCSSVCSDQSNAWPIAVQKKAQQEKESGDVETRKPDEDKEPRH
jgi:hypothetical protein